MSFEDVLAREESWYLEDLLAQGVPALIQEDQGGPFQVVAANPRRLSQGRNQLWLASAESTQGKGSKSDTRWDHDVTAIVLWSALQSTVRANEDQEDMQAAVGRVAARIAGPPGDRGHAGRWWQIGPLRVAPPSPMQLLTFGDVIGGLGAAYQVAITYRVTEWL